MRFDTFFADDMSLPDQEINLDDYLDNNRDNNHNVQVKNLKFESKQNNLRNNNDNTQIKNLKLEAKQNNFYKNNDNNDNTRIGNLDFEFRHNAFIAVLMITWLSLIICCCTKLLPKEGYSNMFMYIFLSQFSKRITVK